MKKLIVLGLALVCVFSLVACSNSKDGNETVSFHDKTINKSELSEETLEWLEHYNTLSSEEQLAISSIPADLYKLCGYGSISEIVADESETVSFRDKTFSKADLSEKTLKWLEHYNTLSSEEQLAISSIPADLYKLCGYGNAAEIVADESETVSFRDKTFNKADLSEETLEWLEHYNTLSSEEQLAISSVPADLYKFCGYGEIKDAEVSGPTD